MGDYLQIRKTILRSGGSINSSKILNHWCIAILWLCLLYLWDSHIVNSTWDLSWWYLLRNFIYAGDFNKYELHKFKIIDFGKSYYFGLIQIPGK